MRNPLYIHLYYYLPLTKCKVVFIVPEVGVNRRVNSGNNSSKLVFLGRINNDLGFLIYGNIGDFTLRTLIGNT
jgi:hypothetical protein